MPKKNAELIGETAEALLVQIKEQASIHTEPEKLRSLADAFATVAAADQVETSGRRGVML
jgi:hypothetical protein